MSQQRRDLIDYKLVGGQSSELIFRVSCGDVKLVLKVASLHLTWLNFTFAIVSALAFSGWHFDKTYDQLLRTEFGCRNLNIYCKFHLNCF